MDSILLIIISLVIIIVMIVFLVLFFYFLNKRKKEIEEQVLGLAGNTLEMTPEEFFRMRNTSINGRSYALTLNFEGVYILYNSTKNMYYVGKVSRF